MPIPYHIFEPRYQALIRDLKRLPNEERWIAIPQLRSRLAGDQPGRPGFHSVATVGRVVDMLAVGGGRFDILVEGLFRCNLHEVHSPHPYRMVRPTILKDLDEAVFDFQGSQRPASFQTLEQGILALVAMVGEQANHLLGIVSSEVKPSLTLYRLGATLLHDPKRRQEFLELQSIVARSNYLVDTLAGLLAVANRYKARSEEGSYS